MAEEKGRVTVTSTSLATYTGACDRPILRDNDISLLQKFRTRTTALNPCLT